MDLIYDSPKFFVRENSRTLPSLPVINTSTYLQSTVTWFHLAVNV